MSEKDIEALQTERKQLGYDFIRAEHVGLSENTARVMRNVIRDRIKEIDKALTEQDNGETNETRSK